MFLKTKKFISFNPIKKAINRTPPSLLLLLVILPLIIAAFYTSSEIFHDFNDTAISRRQTIAFLASSTLKEKLDRMIDVGRSLSTRVQFQKLVEAGKGNEAIEIMKEVPKDFPYITLVSLFDSRGTLMAATPLTPELSFIVGQDFSYRDYYQITSKEWKPYIAEAIKPSVPLGYNLVPVAIPITSELGKKLGILLLVIKLDTITEWSKNINVGPAGFVYIVDQKGHLIAHPTLLPAEDIVDFSSVPAVQKVLKGERGIEIFFNSIENQERVTAYEPVEEYGWGVIVTQPTKEVFTGRGKAVGMVISIWVLVIFATFFAYWSLRSKEIINRTNQELEAVNQQLRASNQQLDAGTQQLRATNQQLVASEKILKEKLAELEVFNKATVGRELKMVELKKENEALKERIKNS